MAERACWHKQNKEDVITTAGGGCYVSGEEGQRSIRMAAVSLVFLHCSVCSHYWACSFCNMNKQTVGLTYAVGS